MQFCRCIKIGDKIISDQSATFIIAEAGVNHNGDVSIAKRLIDIAAESGVDAIKFQSFKTKHLILENVEKAPYQIKATSHDETQADMLRRLEFSKESLRYLKEYSEDKGLIFLSTPFEEFSLEELYELDIAAYKIAATDLTNIQFLRKVAYKKKPIILSAGMCYLEEVKKALETIYPINKNLILLQCTADYPILDEDANIGVIRTFYNNFNILVGYSDHSQGVGASPYAVALGAKVIEKHFTLDRNMIGPDHKASIEPDELKSLVQAIRKVEKYIGDGEKMPTYSEQSTRKALQKCLVAKRKIEKGEYFSDANIVAKRTNGEGISALYYDSVIGKISNRTYLANEIIIL